MIMIQLKNIYIKLKMNLKINNKPQSYREHGEKNIYKDKSYV